MRIGVVFNHRSGARRGDKTLAHLQDALRNDDHVCQLLQVDAGCDIAQSLQEILPKVDAIAAVGGDGTLGGVVNGILCSSVPETPVAFFPVGRGKDVARSLPAFSTLGMPMAWRTTHKVDVLHARMDSGVERYVLNASDIGLIGAATEFSGRLPRLVGSVAYVLGGIYGFLVTRPGDATIVLDDEPPMVLDNVLSIAVCNGKAFGGGIYIAPDAMADDGLLDVVALRGANLMDLLLNLPKLKRGTLRNHPALTRWRAKSVRIETSSLHPVDVDGDMWGAAPITYKIIPSALNWIGPRP